MAAQHIVDGCALLSLDAERHDLNTTMMVSKQAGKPDPIYFNNIIEAQVKIMSIIIKKIVHYLQVRGGGTRWSCIAACGNVFWWPFGQPMPIATHPPIGKVMSYQPMCGNWHRLAKKAAKINSPGKVFLPWWERHRRVLW